MDALTLATQRAQLADLHRQIEGNRKAIDDALQTLDRLIEAPEGRTCLARINEVRNRYVASSARVLELMDEGRQAEAVKLMNAETLPALGALQGPIKGLLKLQMKDVPLSQSAVKQQLDSALTLLTVLDGAPVAVWQSSSRSDF